MKKWFLTAVLCLPLLALGCAGNGPPARELEPAGQTAATVKSDDVVAMVNGDAITYQDMLPVLLKGWGLNVLLMMVQLDLARQDAARAHVVVTPHDLDEEHRLTMVAWRQATHVTAAPGAATQPDEGDLPVSAEESQAMLDQFLAQQHLSEAEFDVLMEINATLRKICEPEVDKELTDQRVHDQFEVLYGAKLVVHYIACNTPDQMADVERDLAAGKSFEDVAKARSLDPRTAPLGGALPPFTMQDNSIPAAFKELCFKLKPGQVSDALQLGDAIYLAKLIEIRPPAHANYADYKDDVRADLRKDLVRLAITVKRQQLGREAVSGEMSIKDPILKKAWQDRLDQEKGSLKDQGDIRKDLDRQHAPATRP